VQLFEDVTGPVFVKPRCTLIRLINIASCHSCSFHIHKFSYGLQLNAVLVSVLQLTFCSEFCMKCTTCQILLLVTFRNGCALL